MEKILKGIVIILFGILCCVFGMASNTLFSGDYSYVFSALGAFIGVFGLVYTFVDIKNKSNR